MKLAEGTVCEIKLYDYYCDDHCMGDCHKIYGPKSQGYCNGRACMCRKPC